MTSITAERINEFRRADLNDLCDATEAAIRDGNGFGWLTPPPRATPWAGATPATVSWSVSAMAESPRSAASSTRASGLSVPSDAVEWVWRSIMSMVRLGGAGVIRPSHRQLWRTRYRVPLC